MKKIFYIITIICFSCTQNIFGATIHYISFATTDDSEIGASVAVSQDLMIRAIGFVAAQTGMTLKLYKKNGADCTREKLDALIARIDPDSDDVIMFFSHTHGFRFDDTKSQWPYVYMTPNSAEGADPVKSSVALKTNIHDRLKAKGARLTITMAEACNVSTGISTPDGVSKMTGLPSEALKKLFMESGGDYIVSSSQPGEYSWGGDKEGGWFTNGFLLAMNDATSEGSSVTWDTVFNFTVNKTANISRKTLSKIPDESRKIGATGKIQKVQTPQYKFATGSHVNPFK
jgi:hypothetical protein